MKLLERFFPDHEGRRELPRLLALMGLFFLVVCAVGVLRPIKNALALDGLGDTDFYKTYLVSAAVIFFVPFYNRLSDRVAWRWLIPVVAFSFAIELVVFRLLYVEGSTAFGLIFYGWYDLFAAALVTQFFMATQLFFNARSAKQAYPLVIAGGSLGATLGSAITGFFSQRVGAPNLLLVAAALITIFSLTLPLVWGQAPPPEKKRHDVIERAQGELQTLWQNRQVRLIAISVLITILVKQLVDYQYNTVIKSELQERDAISAFQGKVNMVTQWLPIVALAALQPLLKRWGVGLAVLMLPVAMLVANVGLEIWWGLWAAVMAKGAADSLRYSTERAAREILYVPVPEDIKLRAKAYIDVAIEKGLGKVLSAALIALLLAFMSFRQIALVGVALSSVWLFIALAVRSEYVRTLARSIEGRFASLRGGFASIADAHAQAAVRRALSSNDARQAAFALDLAAQAAPRDLEPLASELHALLNHSTESVRERALRVLLRAPQVVDRTRVQRALRDPDPDVRDAAAETLCAAGNAQTVIEELLRSADAGERTAALSCLARGVVPREAARLITRDYIEAHLESARAGARDARIEVALAAGALAEDQEAADLIVELAADADAGVARAALHSAGQLRSAALIPVLIQGLGSARTRTAARLALALHGERVAEPLTRALLDQQTPNPVRRQIPLVLSQIPTGEAVSALMRSYVAPETDQVLDFRTLKALSKLRARNPTLPFDRAQVLTALSGEVAAATRYATLRRTMDGQAASSAAAPLLLRALDEAWAERREGAFRLLGLLFPPDGMRDCHQALANTNGRARANAIEWLEQTIGHELFQRLEPLLREARSSTISPVELASNLAAVRSDNDAWIARLAQRVALELNLAGVTVGPTPLPETTMDPIEKVFLLQQVDLLQGARSAHLTLLASIAYLKDVPADAVLVRKDEPTSALHIVVRGAVELKNADDQVLVAGEGKAFGTWALIDRAPSMVTARALENTRVLRIDRDDFDDLLSENPELALGLLQGLARRVRTLVA
ncbi:MAG: Npt1/Npt2 family nucleotide transporter [Longimicrobiales bacterium]